MVLDQFTPRIFLGAAQRRLCANGAPIFTYHYIAKPPPAAKDPYLYFAPERFEQQLALLRGCGFESASLEAATSSNQPGRLKAVITFDDGCRNVFEHALGALQRHGFHAIQFIVAGLIGRENLWDAKHGDVVEPLMDEAQIREWLEAGHEIGSHSLTHPNLTHRTGPELHEEIFASKKRLEDRFGVRIRHFCYPHGRWTPQIRDLVAEAGYDTACTTRFGVNGTGDDPFTLRRIVPLSTSELAGKATHRLKRKLASVLT